MKRLLLPLLLAWFSSPVFAAGDLDRVRANFIGYMTAEGADRTSSRMQQALAELEWTTETFTAPQYLLSDGSWSDINYSDTPGGSWSPWDHTRRLIVMAKAYRTPGQRFYRDPQLLTQIDSALRKVNDYYGARVIPNGNWWFWTIGVPLDLGPTLVLMGDEVDPKTVDDLVFAIRLRIGNSPFSKGLIGPKPVGENLAWSAQTHQTLALLENDEKMMGLVRDAMIAVAQPTAGDGLQSDSSFHQHGPQIYNGGYGGTFASDVARYALIARDTSFALPQQSLDTFANYVADGIAWTLYGDYFDVSVVGREVARPSTTGYQGIAALLQASRFDSPRRPEIHAAAAAMLRSWQWGLPTELAGLAAMIETSGTEAAWPDGYRHYYESDFTVHRRPRWYTSVKMHSNRTKSGERTNGENIHGARQSDGRFYLVQEGNEYFGRNVWPALDWSRLPGITVEQLPTAADDTYGFGKRSFAGGTGDGVTGVSAMELAPLNSTLTAKKSWFFMSDAIVFLTSDITAMTSNSVETIVNQWPLMNPGAQMTSGSNWNVLEGVGYYFPSGGNLKFARDTRSGTWAALGGSADTTEYSTTFQTIWFDHGTFPNRATAEYVIVPDTTPQRMQSWIASNPISILANNANVAAVRDNRDGSTGIVFWTAGVFDGVQVSAPAIVQIKPTRDGAVVNIADPTNGNGTIELTLPRPYSTTIEVPRNGGRTFSTTVKQARPVRRRAVR